MIARPWLAPARLLLAALTVTAIVTQLAIDSGRPDFSAVNFFSYFTIQSNLFAVVVLVMTASRRGDRPEWLDRLRGAAVTYLSLTGIVYALLLADEPGRTIEPWVNTVVHRIMPIALVLDWLVDPPRHAIGVARAMRWVVYPSLFLVYSLVRGPITDWYPYPFLDVDTHGYATVLITCAVMAAGLIAWIAAVVKIGDALGRRESVPTT